MWCVDFCEHANFFNSSRNLIQSCFIKSAKIFRKYIKIDLNYTFSESVEKIISLIIKLRYMDILIRNVPQMIYIWFFIILNRYHLWCWFPMSLHACLTRTERTKVLPAQPGFWVGPSCAQRTLAGVGVQIVLRLPGRRCLECGEVVTETVRWGLSSLCGQMLRGRLPELFWPPEAAGKWRHCAPAVRLPSRWPLLLLPIHQHLWDQADATIGYWSPKAPAVTHWVTDWSDVFWCVFCLVGLPSVMFICFIMNESM